MNTKLANNVADAKAQYAEARKTLAQSIKDNQKAMHAFRATPSAANKAAYEATRAAHKAQLANIKSVRSNFYKLVNSQIEA